MAAWNKAFLQARSFGCSFIMFFLKIMSGLLLAEN